MSIPDEPVLGRDFDVQYESVVEDPALSERIRGLVDAEPYAVLCTQGQGQPYGSVVAYAVSPDLTTVVFATPVTTRKFRLLSECKHVALVVDNRATRPDDMMEIEAITATGRVTRVEPGPEFDRWATLLTTRHPYLKSFVAASSCALCRVDVVRYFHVVRFQEVHQWIPTADG